MRYNEDNNLNKNLWKIVFLLLCLSQLHSRHLSSPFLVSIPLAFAIHSLQRRCTAQEERVNAQQFLPAIPCSLLFFMPLVISSCLFLLHWCVSHRGCSPFQCVPALVWVTCGLNSPQMHTSSCTSFSVSHMHPHSSPPVTSFVSLFVCPHMPPTPISPHMSSFVPAVPTTTP